MKTKAQTKKQQDAKAAAYAAIKPATEPERVNAKEKQDKADAKREGKADRSED